MDTVQNTIEKIDTVDIDLSPENIIALTQLKAIEVFNTAVENETPRVQIDALKLLASTALTSKRINVDNSNAAADRQIAIALSNSMKNIGSNPFLIPNSNININTPILPEANLVFEEDSTILTTIGLDELID